jgi:hypothetical protein
MIRCRARAKRRRPQRSHKQREKEDEDTVPEDRIDESLEETFPASDPPSWAVPVKVGAPLK